MKSVWSAIQFGFIALGGWLGYVLGGCDGFLYALVFFVAVDYITGFLCGIAEKKLSSEVGFRGICKKVLIFVMVAIGHLVDRELIGNGEIVRTAVLFFYLSNEGVSLLENASRLGLPVPQKLRDILVQLHNKNIDGGNNGDK